MRPPRQAKFTPLPTGASRGRNWRSISMKTATVFPCSALWMRDLRLQPRRRHLSQHGHRGHLGQGLRRQPADEDTRPLSGNALFRGCRRAARQHGQRRELAVAGSRGQRLARPLLRPRSEGDSGHRERRLIHDARRGPDLDTRGRPQAQARRLCLQPELVWLLRLGPNARRPLCLSHGKPSL